MTYWFVETIPDWDFFLSLVSWGELYITTIKSTVFRIKSLEFELGPAFPRDMYNLRQVANLSVIQRSYLPNLATVKIKWMTVFWTFVTVPNT